MFGHLEVEFEFDSRMFWRELYICTFVCAGVGWIINTPYISLDLTVACFGGSFTFVRAGGGGEGWIINTPYIALNLTAARFGGNFTFVRLYVLGGE